MKKDIITFEIKECIALLREGKSGWNTELNLVSWNGAEPKYDIRAWNQDHSKMGKGITLSKDEMSIIAGSFGIDILVTAEMVASWIYTYVANATESGGMSVYWEAIERIFGPIKPSETLVAAVVEELNKLEGVSEVDVDEAGINVDLYDDYCGIHEA